MYNFTIQYRPGKNHSNADIMSRRPCFFESCKHCDKADANQIANCVQQVEGGSVYVSNLDNRETFKVNLVIFPEYLAEEVWSLKELHDAQEKDADIAPVVQWLKEGTARPPRETVLPFSIHTKL